MSRIAFRMIEVVAKKLRGNSFLRKSIYDPFKVMFRRRLCSFDYMLYYMTANKQYEESFVDSYDAPGESKRIGILKDPFLGHEPYIVACKEMGVGYRVVDIFAHDWIEQIKNSGCKVFLVWPGECIQEWKRLYDDRLRIMVDDIGLIVFPDIKATWMYGSKERQSAWLELNGFPHPKTWVFYRKPDVEDFLHNKAQYPLVAKTDIGAVASGVTILRSESIAKRYADKAFSHGIQGYYSDRQTWQWRHVLFQEHLADAKEWRVHRIGDSFFGFGKVKRGDFHSGSGETDWTPPPIDAFNLAWKITERGGFRSMAVDMFETTDGRFLVNELQCVYGQHGSTQLVKDGVSGRMLRSPDGEWCFEAGDFCANHGCNLRIQEALKLL